jgi:hypothetical protein
MKEAFGILVTVVTCSLSLGSAANDRFDVTPLENPTLGGPGLVEVPLAEQGDSRIVAASICAHLVVARRTEPQAYQQGFKFQNSRCRNTRSKIGRD